MFIVRIWHEPREIEGVAPEWRGTIEHVSSGEQRHVKDMDDITAFVGLYLAGTGGTSETRWRVARWVARWKHWLSR